MHSNNEKTADVVARVAKAIDGEKTQRYAESHNQYRERQAKAALAAMPKVSEEELAKALCDEAWKRDCRSGATKEDWATYNWKYYARSARSILARLPQIRKE